MDAGRHGGEGCGGEGRVMVFLSSFPRNGPPTPRKTKHLSVKGGTEFKAMHSLEKTLSISPSLVHSIGISLWDPIWATLVHPSVQSELVHVLNHHLVLHAGGKTFPAKAGDTLIVPVGTPHRDSFPLDADFEVLHITFTLEKADRHFPIGINEKLLRLSDRQKKRIAKMIFDLYESFRSGGPLAEEISRVHLHLILLTIENAVASLSKSQSDIPADGYSIKRAELVSRPKSYIQSNLNRPITLVNIAAHLGISSYHLSHLFSQESGFTFSSFLLRNRMERAAAILMDPGKRISEAAYAVGFSDANHFAKTFRRYFSKSPTDYRAQKLAGNRKKTP